MMCPQKGEAMLHEPAREEGKDHAVSYKAKLGVRMFLLYTVVYAGFVALNVIKPVVMEVRVVFGLNLAVVYGFGLIVFAVILALIYNRMCGKKEKTLNSGSLGGGR